MPIHERVLEAALRICRERGGWTFRPAAVVAALADLNPASVRTHVMSRCCVNAPAHHAHRWPYFRRRRRGVYEIQSAWRRRPERSGPESRARRRRSRARADAGIIVELRESGTGYAADIPGRPGTIRGASLDEVVERVRGAARENREEDASPPGSLRLQVVVELEVPDPVLAAYEKDIDRTLVRRRLRMGIEERLQALESWMKDTAELRGAARRPRRRAAR